MVDDASQTVPTDRPSDTEDVRSLPSSEAASTRLVVRYFASVRERIGMTEESVEIPATVTTVGGFIDWMRQRDDRYEAALAEELRIRAAVDHRHANPDRPIAGASEIALFPVVTGG